MIKDRNSRSFIPIAEEYLRSGMIDEAIGVLKAGLQVYPDYLGARVSLGKIYLEKGKHEEALKEFQYVVNLSPDNILAHRNLISIYKDTGRIEEAIKGCETLIAFYPRDNEIIKLHNELMHKRVIPLQFVETAGEEPSVEEDEQEGDEETFLTETMGDLLIAQGEIDKGIETYRRLRDRAPENISIKEKLEKNLRKLETGFAVRTGTNNIKEIQINRLQGLLEKVQKNKR